MPLLQTAVTGNDERCNKNYFEGLYKSQDKQFTKLLSSY